MAWTTLIDVDLASSPASTSTFSVSGYIECEVLLSKVNNAADAAIEIHTSSDGGSTYETSNIWQWAPGSGRTTQSVIGLKRAYAGVGNARAIITNLNDADAGIHWFRHEGDFVSSRIRFGAQSTPSAIDYLKVASNGGSNMDFGWLLVRART